jgi:hypothetical protein
MDQGPKWSFGEKNQRSKISVPLLLVGKTDFLVALVAPKGVGIFFHVLHVYYSFHQKCSKLDTFTA